MSVPASGRIRVVVAKLGPDEHDRGVQVLARALRDAGVEVVYAGLHQSPEQVVATVLAEDADAVGLSVLPGEHLALFARTIELLRARDAADVIVFGGGIVPAGDIPRLAVLGVATVFAPGVTAATVTRWVRETFPQVL